jgi:hypothetical protein
MSTQSTNREEGFFLVKNPAVSLVSLFATALDWLGVVNFRIAGKMGESR